MIMKTVFCYSSSALHIVEVRVVELSLGISPAQFLFFALFVFSSISLLDAMCWRRNLKCIESLMDVMNKFL